MHVLLKLAVMHKHKPTTAESNVAMLVFLSETTSLVEDERRMPRICKSSRDSIQPSQQAITNNAKGSQESL